MKRLPICFAAFAACTLIACGGKDDDKGADEKAGPAGGHAHEATHGGDMLELGDHEGFMEIKVNHDAGRLTIWLSREGNKALVPTEPPVLNFVAGEKPVQVIAKGSDGEWFFMHEGLKGEPQKVRFRIEFGGKTYTPRWDHQH